MTNNDIMVGIERNGMPKHISFIMDGNGRWAQYKSLPISRGHYEGLKSFIRAVSIINQLDIKYMTVYALSTENWQRPKDEIDGILHILHSHISVPIIRRLNKNNIRVRILGDMSIVPKDTLKLIDKIQNDTINNDGLDLGICFSYGGRREIVHTAKQIAQQVLDNKLKIDDIDENLFRSNMYYPDRPYPDLIIRTGERVRLSNFLTWQSSYAELFFTNALWPDFNKDCIIEAITCFKGRQRTFGRRM